MAPSGLLIFLSLACASSALDNPLCQQCSTPGPSSPSLTSYFPKDLWNSILSKQKDMVKLDVPLDLPATLANLTQELKKGSKGRTCVRFTAYCNQKDCNKGKELRSSDKKSLSESGCSKDKPTIILLPGWLEPADFKCAFPAAAKDVYCRNGDRNVIMIDYSRCPGYATYILAVCRDQKEVAAKTAELIQAMEKVGKIDSSKLRVSGISLGAQMGAAICNEVKEKLKKRCTRLTCLDPAGPAYDWPKRSLCGNHVVSAKDADYVDCYHTNAEGGGFGMQTCGKDTANYFVNGGKSQCWCTPATLMPLSGCSHISSAEVFTTTLHNPKTGVQRCACKKDARSFDQCRSVKKCCDSRLPFGESATNTIGDFYIPFNFTELEPTLKKELGNCAA